jgi:hypothetical protein
MSGLKAPGIQNVRFQDVLKEYYTTSIKKNYNILDTKKEVLKPDVLEPDVLKTGRFVGVPCLPFFIHLCLRSS